MERNHLLRKGLVCGIIVLFLGMSIIPIVGSLSVEKEQSLITKSCFDDIIFNGTMGENGWYTSDVTVTFVDGNYTFFRIDNGSWIVYTVPFVISTDGIHLIEATSDFEHIYNITIKIDRTAPECIPILEKIGHNKYRIYAEVSDATSGVNRVEFYLNDYLIYTDYEAPYEWFYKGPSFDISYVTWDIAGNSCIPGIWSEPINYFAIGSINNPQFGEYDVTFFAEFVIVIEYSFLYFHISTLTNQQFAIHIDYMGNIGENFMIIKYTGYRNFAWGP